MSISIGGVKAQAAVVAHKTPTLIRSMHKLLQLRNFLLKKTHVKWQENIFFEGFMWFDTIKILLKHGSTPGFWTKLFFKDLGQLVEDVFSKCLAWNLNV